MCWNSSPKSPSNPKFWNGWGTPPSSLFIRSLHFCNVGWKRNPEPWGPDRCIFQCHAEPACSLVKGVGPEGREPGRAQVPSSPHPAPIKGPFHSQSPCNLLSLSLLCSEVGALAIPQVLTAGLVMPLRLGPLLPARGGEAWSKGCTFATFPRYPLCRRACWGGSGESVTQKWGPGLSTNRWVGSRTRLGPDCCVCDLGQDLHLSEPTRLLL